MTAVLSAGSLPLPARWHDLLRDGNDGDYATDGAAVMAVAVAMVRAGHTGSDFVREMSEPDNRLSAWYRRKDDGRRRGVAASAQKMWREWDKAVRFAADNPQVHSPAEALQQLGLIRAATGEHTWAGRSAARDQWVLSVLIAEAQRRTTLTPAISLRTICEASPFRRPQTIANAIRSLSSRGWVEVVSPGSRSLPAVYRLRVPKAGQGVKAAAQVGVKDVDTSLPLKGGDPDVHGLYTSGTQVIERSDAALALVHGVHAAAVHAVLEDGPGLNPTEIARRSGKSRPTVYKWLAVLLALGLVRQCPDSKGWSRAARGQVTAVIEAQASELEMARVERHAAQRHAWHDLGIYRFRVRKDHRRELSPRSRVAQVNRDLRR